VCEGTPEEVARHATSYTGKFLAPLLRGRAKANGKMNGKPHRAGRARARVREERA
jgi:excinuclease ABC subunit A